MYYLPSVVPGTEEGWSSIPKQFMPFSFNSPKIFTLTIGIVKYFKNSIQRENEFYELHQNFTLLSTNHIALHINKLLWDERKKAKSEPPCISKTWSIVYENWSVKDRSFRMCGLWSAALTFSGTKGMCKNYWQRLCEYCPRSQGSDWYSRAHRVTKGKKTQVSLWQEVTDEWYSYIHRERLLPCCAHSFWIYSYHWEIENWLQNWHWLWQEVAFGTSKQAGKKIWVFSIL